ncbi:hypothetical protein [Kushneria aurantia]|uniref:Lipoprotein n=1 Tax=Kushneria aurantia TaxID=504092 RepID=A0ABV6G6G7_9GAMM|nr:hypothetical protein [Kushneria aurantia]
MTTGETVVMKRLAALVLACALSIPAMLTGCSTTASAPPMSVSAEALDATTAHDAALDLARERCAAGNIGSEVAIVDDDIVAPSSPQPAEGGINDDSEALAAATSEGDRWRATLSFQCLDR